MYNRDFEILFIEEYNDKLVKMYVFKVEVLVFLKVYFKI